MSDPADYDEEAAIFRRTLDGAASRPVREVLELGCGGGNNAFHLKKHYRMTLTDVSPEMLAQSRRINPECEHLEGDMRTLRLGRTFDAVFVHDAVLYMTTEKDLLAAMTTAFVHTRPGGAAIFTPDYVKENFREGVTTGGNDREGRSLRYVEWTYDPDPEDTTFLSDYVYLWREPGGTVEMAEDRHVLGLFPKDTWLDLLGRAGFEPRAEPYDGSSFDPPVTGDLFLGVRA